MPSPLANANIARHLATMAVAQPDAAALKIPRGRTAEGRIDYLTLTFAELDAEVDAWCARLAKSGLRRGDRTLVMVRQGLPLIAAVFALFKVGAVPVVLDAGMTRETLLKCVARTRPRALLGIPSARFMSRFYPTAFASIEVRIAASGSLTARLTNPKSRKARDRYDTAICAENILAAILFTSGSTGSPKGVCYEHGMFDAQVRLIRETYGIAPGEIDLPLLSIFALFNPALGMTTVVPEMDPKRPGEFDPAKVVQAIQQENVTTSFGSPTLWGRIGDQCIANNTTLPSLRRVLCAGAPVPAELWRKSRVFLPNGKMHSPYGATEALPVSNVSVDEIESAIEAPGTCVGRPIAGVEIRIIAASDGRIATVSDVQELRTGAIGEIIVRGPMVTKTYDDMPPATTAAKIAYSQDFAANAGVWHRMGDCGYVDENGRLWFCGRKAERVETADGTLYPEPCEQVFRAHPRAARCALIGFGERGAQVPALVVEAKLKNNQDGGVLARELQALGRENKTTAGINTFFFRPHFPMDVRHNAKIHRLALTKWAATTKPFQVVSGG